MKVVMYFPTLITCPHCKKQVGSGVIRTIKVKGIVYIDKNKVECPRPECGKLIGFLELAKP